MRTKNICKFVPEAAFQHLSIACFVLEADLSVIKKPTMLGQNRMILVLDGRGLMHFDHTSLPIARGSLIFGFKNELFYTEKAEGLQYMYIDFDGIRARELLRRFDISLGSRYFAGQDGLIPLWQESLSRALDNTIDLAAESMLLYTFSRLSGCVSAQDQLIGRMMEITEEHFTDPALTLSTLAAQLGYNSKYLSHFFKKKTGTGYTQYLKELRLRFAVSLLEHGLDSIKNVALLSGFSDPLYFSTVFKQAMGVSPTEYIHASEH